VDLEPCEDAHAQERTLVPAVLERAQAGDLWIGDRNFCTRAILTAMVARGAALLIREHGASPNPTPVGRRLKVGQGETGVVYEQAVTIETEAGERLELRRIELELDQPTEDGDTLIRLLTNLPAERFDAREVARLYRRRWSIEGLFQKLEAVLKSEVNTLGYPRAALLAFTTAVLAYNVLEVIQAAVEAEHDLPSAGIELSSYFIAGEVTTYYAGMTVAVEPDVWLPFDDQSPAELSQALRRLAAHVDPKTLRKHPRAPKPKVKKGYIARASVQRHVATARVLCDGRVPDE